MYIGKLLCVVLTTFVFFVNGLKFSSKTHNCRFIGRLTNQKDQISKATDHSRIVRSSLSSTLTDEPILEDGINAPPRKAYLALWLCFVTYAFTLAPTGSAKIDEDLIKLMISTPFEAANTVSPIFVAIFNSLGVLPAIYASLLLPGGSLSQKVPALPFVISSFALGFFGLGPYLGLRNKREVVLDSERGRGSVAFEFKGTSLAMLSFAVYLLYFGISGAYGGNDRISDYLDLFSTSQLAHVSTIDFTILSLAVADPMSEDMRRRNFEGPSAIAFAAFPVIGPCLYLLLRPPLPKS